MTAELAPIPVPQQLRAPHKVVKAQASHHTRLRPTNSVHSRGLRLLQAITAEAEGRGYRIEAVKATEPSSYRRQAHSSGLLAVAVKGHPVLLDLTQEYDSVAHVSTVAERRRKERESWFRIPAGDGAVMADLV